MELWGGVHSLLKRRLRRNPVAAYNFLKNKYRTGGAKLLGCTDKFRRSCGHRLKVGRWGFDIRGKVCLKRVVQCWRRLHRKAAEFPSSATLKGLGKKVYGPEVVLAAVLQVEGWARWQCWFIPINTSILWILSVLVNCQANRCHELCVFCRNVSC